MLAHNALTHAGYSHQLKLKQPNLKLLSEYAGAGLRIKYSCSVCKYVGEHKANALRLSGCQQCYKNNAYSMRRDSILQEVASKHPEFDVAWHGSDTTRINVRHTECKHSWNIRRHSFFGLCHFCMDVQTGRKTIKRSINWYKTELAKVRSDIVPVGEYTNSNTKLKHKCTTCNNVWLVQPWSALNNKIQCQHCKDTLVAHSVRGKVFRVRGYEPQAISYMMNKLGIQARDIQEYNSGSVPLIKYRHCGVHRYYPDFLVSGDTIVEVKSVATLGLTTSHYAKGSRPSTLFYKTAAKAKACIEAGYKFNLLLMTDKGDRIKLPRNWSDLTYKEIKSCVEK